MISMHPIKFVNKFVFRLAHEDRICNDKCSRPGCTLVPATGQKFKVCSGCRECAYCSVGCQTIHWKAQKTLCKHMQQDNTITEAKDLARKMQPKAASNSLPPLKERINLLSYFITAHSRSFQKSVHCEILLRGGVDNFDFRKHYMKFELRYRSDCGGNPGVAFNVESAEIRPLSEIDLLPSAKEALDAGKATRDAAEAHRKETSESFVGLFLSRYNMEGYGLWHTDPLHRTAKFDEHLKTLHPEMWFRELSKSVKMGMVFQQTHPDELGQKFGRIKKVGCRWEWVQLTPEELVAIGMPADCPGLLF